MSTATPITAIDPAVARYVEGFDPPRDALYDRRVAAFERFKALGFPGPRDEAWRQTSIKGITGTAFLPAHEPTDSPTRGALAEAGLTGVLADRSFVNGRRISGTDAADRATGWLDLAPDDHAFVALNRALRSECACIDVAAGPGPVSTRYLFLNVPEKRSVEHHAGVQVRVAPGARCSILEFHATLGDGAPTFSTHVTELLLGDGAQVEHTVWQQLGPKSHHVAIMQAELGRDARLRCNGFTDGGALTRNEVRARFTAPGAEADFHGLLLGRGSDLVDYHTLVEHATTDSASRQSYRGIFTDRAKGVFEGQVRIRPGAQRTNATQSVKHLLLSDGALAHAKPVLEILADDVKCAHGAAIGQLDEAALFYLRSRGVPFADARRLLVEAFADDVLGRIGDADVRKWLAPRVRAALPLGTP